MLSDARTPDQNTLNAEVCVVGAGPAGIVTAVELARQGRDVILLEAGGTEPPASEQRAIYSGSTGERSYPVQASRLRFLGGTSNHWGGWVRPYSEAEWMPRPHFPLPGWPIDRRDLNRHYDAASEWCEIAPDSFQIGGVVSADQTLFELDGNMPYEHQLFRFSPPTRFGSRYRSLLESQANLRCFLNANVAGGRWQGARLAAVDMIPTGSGESRPVVADSFVFAMGGLETPRILLNMQGNDSPLRSHQMIGRCFMDHWGFQPGNLLASADLKYSRYSDNGTALMPVLAINETAIRESGLNSQCILLSAIEPPETLGQDYLRNPGFSVTSDGEYAQYRVQTINESTPNPASRVSLQNERDSLGLQKLHLDWQIVGQDFDRLRTSVEGLIRFLGASGQGRFRRIKPIDDSTTSSLSFANHHMGACRMADSIDHGVVDRNSRVFETDNLYLAGSSVFPQVGYSNPTLTICALAHRLAGHLAETGDA